MRMFSRLSTLGLVAVLPTAMTLVLPIGRTVPEPHPVKPKTVTWALEAPTGVTPRADAVSPADSSRARGLAGGSTAVKGATSAVALPARLAVVGVTWEKGSGPGTSAQYRTLTGDTWGQWTFLPGPGGDGPDAVEEQQVASRGRPVRDGSEPVVVTGATQIQVRILGRSSRPAPTKAALSVIDPGTSDADASVGNVPGAATASAKQPYIYTRALWGADESLRNGGPYYGSVKAAFVHHTAGSNSYADYEVPAILRGIYAYHVKSLGWSDIGYNFLVDKFGRTWEGRYGGITKAVVGAHTYSLNDETFGVSVLGNFMTASVPPAVTTALSNLIAWKAQVHSFNPRGTATIDGYTYPTIEGHRAAQNNSTECPGDYLYAKLPDVRAAAGALTSGAPSYVDRWSGSDRYATAAAVSASTFPEGARVVFVATGADFPDALAGGPAAAKLTGPVLLTGRDSLPESTAAEIRRLWPQRTIILGGSDVVSDAVAAALSPLPGTLERWAGPDRYATAAFVASETFPAGVPVAFLATGSDFPDALAGGPAGGELGGPVLLTGPDALPVATQAELKRLAPQRVVILGGPSAVSQDVADQVAAATGVVPERSSGVDRFETAAAAASLAFPNEQSIAFVATGADYPDALAGGPAGGTLGGPLLLTTPTVLPQPTVDELKRLGPHRIVILGGTGVVSGTVESQLKAYLR